MARHVSNLPRKVRLGLAEEITEVFIGANRPSGMVSLTFIGKPPASDVPGAVQRVLEEFIDECHSVLICYFGAVVGMANTKDIITQEYEGNTPVTIELSENDATDLVRTRILGSEAIEMFSSGGRFERLQARSLVISIFTEWEAVTRRKLATLLGVKNGRRKVRSSGRLETPEELVTSQRRRRGGTILQRCRRVGRTSGIANGGT